MYWLNKLIISKETCVLLKLSIQFLAASSHHDGRHILVLRLLESLKRVLLQTVKTLMKCSIVLHFIRVSTVLPRLNKPSGSDIHHNYEISSSDPQNSQLDNPILIVSICMGKSIRIQKVKRLASQNIVPPNSLLWTEGQTLPNDFIPPLAGI